MKRGLGALTVLVGLMLFALCETAQALTFTVSNISFNDLTGNNEAFRWSVSPVSIVPFDIPVGNSYTFIYGTFYTDDFPINSPAGSDNDDSFQASFTLMPPDPAATFSKIAVPDATRVQSNAGSVIVDFDNALIDRYFDSTGHYTIEFLDLAAFSLDGSRDLQAKLHYITEGTPLPPLAAPVPEPSTVVLLGSGLLGLIYMGRKRLRK